MISHPSSSRPLPNIPDGKQIANTGIAAAAQAQVAQFSQNQHSIEVNIPTDTASGSSSDIFFRIVAPSGTTWTAFGQGSGMSGANMFVVYSSGDGNVTVSPRLGTGHTMPRFNGNAQVSLLEGSAVQSDGSLMAVVRCGSCLTWGDGNTMSVTDSSSSWIYAYKSGDAMDTTDTSASISIHDDYSVFNLDLTQGTGGSSTNPFITAASATNSGSATSPSQTSGSTVPVTTPDSGSSSSGSVVTDNTVMVRRAHAIVMSAIFLILFPIAALTLYLPYAKKVRHIHAPLQLISLVLLIIGLATGVVLGKRISELDGYHQIIGYLVIAAMVLFQPALGIYQHMHYRKTGGKSPMGIIHRWLGRSAIIVGVVNGGLGFMQAGPVGNSASPSWAVVTYCIVAGVVFFVYASIVLAVGWRSKHPSTKNRGEKARWGYEMNSSQGSSPQIGQSPPRYGNSNTYISNPRGNPGLGHGASRQMYR